MPITLTQFLNSDVDRILKERKLRLPKEISYEDEELDTDVEDTDTNITPNDPTEPPENSDDKESNWTVSRLDDEEDQQDPNRQGMIRKVKDAHLVYKRQTPDGTYEELWIYKIGNKVRSELEIRREILAGTDIDPNKTKSKDGTQSYKLWTKGNVQFVYISGLPN